VVPLLENGHKILLMGCKGSGKTTFLNNLKLLFPGVSDAERRDFIRVVRKDMISAAAQVILLTKSAGALPPSVERQAQVSLKKNFLNVQKILLLDQFDGYSPKQFESDQIDFKVVFSDVSIRRTLDRQQIPANAY
jgi:energy-coupling factor transporter ATP-binding protein EcfA2